MKKLIIAVVLLLGLNAFAKDIQRTIYINPHTQSVKIDHNKKFALIIDGIGFGKVVHYEQRLKLKEAISRAKAKDEVLKITADFSDQNASLVIRKIVYDGSKNQKLVKCEADLNLYKTLALQSLKGEESNVVELQDGLNKPNVTNLGRAPAMQK